MQMELDENKLKVRRCEYAWMFLYQNLGSAYREATVGS